MTELSPVLRPDAELVDVVLNPQSESPSVAPPSARRPSRARKLAAAVFAGPGARFGLAWVVVLAFAAVFAPFLANTNPLLLKQGGHWSSPAVRHLTPADVVLQVAFWAAVAAVAWPAGPAGRRANVRVPAWLAVVAVTTVLAAWLVRPPVLVNYQDYRDDARANRTEFALYAPIRFSPADHLRDQSDVRLTGPTRAHWMGTTSDSADLLSNMIFATRIALSIGFISTGIAVAIGIAVGGLMGYFGGWVDLLGMRVVEVVDAIPTFVLLLCFVAVFPPNLYVMMAIIGLTSWVGYATFVRAEFLSLRDRDFVHAARAAGLPLRSILFRHMLPNGIAPVIVSASFGVASAILTESSLSFLGVGLTDEASWGGLLEQATGESGGAFYWWIATYPGLAIFLTVFSYNLIGESLRDALDPRATRTA